MCVYVCMSVCVYVCLCMCYSLMTLGIISIYLCKYQHNNFVVNVLNCQLEVCFEVSAPTVTPLVN